MQSEFRFTTPFNVRIEKKGETEEIHLDGFISTTDQDLVDDVVTKNCLESMKEQILNKNLKLDIEHEAFRGESVEEKEINKAKIPAGRMYDATVESIGASRFGLRVKSVLNSFRSDFENIKGNVMNNFLDAYSIAFIPTKIDHKEVNGKSVRLLDDVVLLNVAMTGNPINTTAQNREIFMKALDSIEDYKAQKEKDPKLENQLVVKSKEEKGNVLYVILDKLLYGKELGPKENKLLKSAADVAITDPTEKELFNKLIEKAITEKKMSFRDYSIVSSLLDMEMDSEVLETAKSMDKKRMTRTQARNAALRESEEDDDEETDEDKKKKKKKESKNNNHARDKQLNHGGKKIMEKKDESQEEDQKPGESEESQEESQEESSEESSEEAEDAGKEDNEEVKSLRKDVKELQETVKALTAKLKAPVHKGSAEQMEKNVNAAPEKKSVGPLDLIK